MLSKQYCITKVFSTFLPSEYPYDVVGGQRVIKQMDFDERIDIIPVADPNIFSMTQRVTLAQTELQLAMSNPQMHNLYMAYRTMYEAIGVKNIDQILPPPPPPQRDRTRSSPAGHGAPKASDGLPC